MRKMLRAGVDRGKVAVMTGDSACVGALKEQSSAQHCTRRTLASTRKGSHHLCLGKNTGWKRVKMSAAVTVRR